MHTIAVTPDIERILAARHHDPFRVLGRHQDGPDEEVVRAFIPGASEVTIDEVDIRLERVPNTDVFEWRGKPGMIPERYRLRWHEGGGERVAHDPYVFPPQIPDFDLHLFSEGRHWHAYRFLGAHPRVVDGVEGVLFATWAPNAERASVVGDFNAWDGRRHAMRIRGGSGVWELFIPGLAPGALYKFEIRNRNTGTVVLKTDPYARRFELRPSTACLVEPDSDFAWGDGTWMEARAHGDWLHAPMSIYEVHLGSWQRGAEGRFLSYREIAERLVDYVRDLGCTHIELLPVTEHPLDASWGYQSLGFYAPTSRFGSPDDFRYFIDHCHRHGIGVILDWVPGHFPKDAHGLARFDGSALYEHEDVRRGEHRDWGTLIFNYGRREVKNFLLSSALYWLGEFHLDGLRVDAVASMLYLDYSRKAGEWLPNVHGGNENLEAIEFLKEMNRVTHEQHPGSVMIAEESTAWPQVTRPTYLGGLGFSMKWNMGWMHDTLDYMSHDPIHRTYHHDRLTFGLLYAGSENFVLPLSHDEVVHGKRSLLEKMPGDDWRRFANLRALFTFMFTYPGKKLLFMGGEFAQHHEWNFDEALDWTLLEHAPHQGMRSLLCDLNRIYRERPALHRFDFEVHKSFEWVDCHDARQSVISYLRTDGAEAVIVVLNFTPVPRYDYRIGVPGPGHYREVLNSDAGIYGGTNLGNMGGAKAEDTPWMARPYSISLTLPPLAGLILSPESD
jgi:1,4-alpha-glucan branching enzyme